MSDVKGSLDYGRLRRALREELLKQAFVPDAVKYSKNPIAYLGKTGERDENGVGHPCVVRNWKDGLYYLFTTTFSVTYGWDNSVALFISSNGLDFAKYGFIVLPPSGYAGIIPQHVFWCSELGRWRLYCLLRREAWDEVGLFESDDLKTWAFRQAVLTIPGVNLYDSPGIIYNDVTAPRYEMYVWRQDVNRCDRYLSDDGLTFTLDATNVLSRASGLYGVDPGVPHDVSDAVIYKGWRVLVGAVRTGFWGVSIWISKDGRSFYPYARNPIIFSSSKSSAWDRGVCACGRLLIDGEKLWLYYQGGDARQQGVGVAFLNPAIFERLLDSVALYGWKSTSISAGAACTFPINLLGYKRKSLYFESDTAGDLTIEIDPLGDGNFRTIATRTGITSTDELIEHEFAYVRLRFSAAATVTARLSASR